MEQLLECCYLTGLYLHIGPIDYTLEIIQVEDLLDGDIIYVNLLGLQLSDDVAEKF